MAPQQAPKQPSALVEYTKLGIVAAGSMFAWATFEPVSFWTVGFPLVKGILAAGGVTWALWPKGGRKSPIPRQDYESLCTGLHMTGLPGSGKGGYVLGQLVGWLDAGFGGVFCSPAAPDLDKFMGIVPARHRDRIDVIKPGADRPRTFNPLQLYRGDSLEIGQTAAAAAEWFLRDSAAGDRMTFMLEMATVGLLEWATAAGRQVCILDLGDMFSSDTLRAAVLASARPEVRRAFDTAEKALLQRVEALVLSTLKSDNLTATLGSREGDVSILQALQENRWIVLDVREEECLQEYAFLSKAFASLLYRLTPRRKRLDEGGLPFLAVFDEVQDYPTSVFASALAKARKYGVGWCLLHQAKGQIDAHNPLQQAFELVGNHVYFQQTPADAVALARNLPSRWPAESLQALAPREFRGIYRMGAGKAPLFVEGSTPDYPAPDPAGRADLLAANQGRQDRRATIKAARDRWQTHTEEFGTKEEGVWA